MSRDGTRTRGIVSRTRAEPPVASKPVASKAAAAKATRTKPPAATAAGTTATVAKSAAAPADREFVEALARGLAVIEAFDANHAELSLSDVARRVGVSPATARRSLHTLEVLGYVRAVNKRFVLAAKVLTLGSAYLRAAHVDDALMPELRRVVALFGDASSAGVLDGPSVLYVAHVSEQRSYRPTAGIGVTYPAYATSLGRVLLAGLTPAELDRWLAETRFEKLTERTETDPGRLRRIVEETRRRGYAVTVDELAYGVTAMAVPVKGPNGQTVAAINTSGYTGNLDPDKLVGERLAELRVAAERLGGLIARYPALQLSLARGTPAPAAPPEPVGGAPKPAGSGRPAVRRPAAAARARSA